MSSLHLQLFGTPELRLRGQPVPFRTRKHLALLIYLALEATKRPAGRELLIELLWPNLSRLSARHSLSQGLSVIRRLLGEGAVAKAKEEVVLTAPVTTDLDLLVSGTPNGAELDQPLRGMDTCAGPAFAHWVDAKRQRLRDGARERLAAALAAAQSEGDVTKVHERAALLYQVDPLSDAAAQALAERLLLGGDRVGAIRLLRRHSQRTQVDAGYPAGAEVLRRLRQLERGSGGESRPGTGAAVHTAEPERLIARESELARLEALWSDVTRRGLLSCLVTGPAGIGKSTLVHRFSSSVAARGWPVFSVACQEIGRAIPFAAVSDLIYALAAVPAISGTDPVWLSEVSRVTPGIKSLYPGVPDPTSVVAEAVRIRVAESIGRVLEVLADGGPTLLLFDDVQDMDPATRDVLHVLLRRLEATPTLVLGTLRTTDSWSFGPAEDPRSPDLAWQDRIALTPLTAEEARDFVAARLSGSEPLDGVIHEKVIELAEGNPYLLEMLLMDWQRDGAYSLVAAEVEGDGTGARWCPPDTMRKAFERQYRGLSSTAQRLLAVLAVAGKKLSAAEIGAFGALDSREIDSALVEVIDRGIVRVDGACFGFKNEIHRTFVYFALLSEDSRKYHHGRLTTVLESRTTDHDFQRALEVSHHSLRAGMVEKAVAHVIEGAEVAINRGAPREAERALKGVLGADDHLTRPQILLLLSRSRLAQGRYYDSLDTLSQVPEGTLSRDEQACRDVLRAEALHRGRLAPDPIVADAARNAQSSVAAARSTSLTLNCLQVSAEIAADKMDWESLERIALRASRIALRTRSEETRGLAHLTHGFCLMVNGEHQKAVASLREAERIMRRRSRQVELRMILNGIGICHTNAGAYECAEPYFLEARQLAHRLGDLSRESLALDNLAVLYEDLGFYTKAAECFREALELCERAPNPRRSVLLGVNAASLAISLGNDREATNLLDAAQQLAHESQVKTLVVAVLAGQADLHLAKRDYQNAWGVMEELMSLTGGKAPLDGIAGQFERLVDHYTWATMGLKGMLDLKRQALRGGIGNRLALRLESAAFREWVLDREGQRSESEKALQKIEDREFLGILGRLHTLCTHREKNNSSTVESAARWVAERFPFARRERVPTSIF